MGFFSRSTRGRARRRFRIGECLRLFATCSPRKIARVSSRRRPSRDLLDSPAPPRRLRAARGRFLLAAQGHVVILGGAIGRRPRVRLAEVDLPRGVLTAVCRHLLLRRGAMLRTVASYVNPKGSRAAPMYEEPTVFHGPHRSRRLQKPRCRKGFRCPPDVGTMFASGAGYRAPRRRGPP